MIIDLLSNTDLFKGLTSEQLIEIGRLSVSCHFDANEQVFEQDQYADYLYLILNGEVCIRFKPYDGEWIPVSTIRKGQVFGWSSVLGQPSYTSAAVCTIASDCIRIRGREILNLCESHPETGILIMERLAAVIADRLSKTNEQIFKLLTQKLDSPVVTRNRRSDGTNQL